MPKLIYRFSFLVFLSLVVSLLVVSFSSSNFLNGNVAIAQRVGASVTPTPVAAILTWFQGNGIKLAVGLNQTPVRGNEIIDLSQWLLIPGTRSDEAKLGFVANTRDTNNIPGYLAQAGPSSIDAFYRFPCTNGRGEFVIAWWQVGANPSQPYCNEVEVNLESRIGPVSYLDRNKEVFIPSQVKQLNAQREARIYIRQYCNVIAESGAWGISYSREGSEWEGEVTARQICNEALEKCKVAGGGDSCSIVSMSEWSAEETRHRLLLRCADSSIISEEIVGRNVYERLRQIEQTYYEPLINSNPGTQQQTFCRVSIYRGDSVLISPLRGETSIQITNSGNGLVINTLTGEINVRPAERPETSEIVRFGEKYVYRNLAFGFEGEKSSISTSEKKEIVQSAIVQSFLRESGWLNPQYWSNNIIDRIRRYRVLIESEFCEGSPCLAQPSVQVNRATVDGIDIWKAEVDLDNPETIVTLAQIGEIQQVGGVADFARTSNAALITNGTFREDSNWTMKSQGSFIVGGRNDRFYSNYTVLGLRRDNQPEMVPRPEVSNLQWEEYWFALTGHPRLVNGGVPGVTEIAPGATLDMTGGRGRSAIGFSRNPRKLYYVSTNQGVPLSRMARIMSLVGCDEAMNLEGDAGRFLACNGDSSDCNGNLLVNGGTLRAPLIVVYDAQHSRNAIRTNWQRYLSGF